MRGSLSWRGVEVFGEHRMSFSVGAAQFGRDGRTVEDLLSEADRRMFKNKRKLAGTGAVH